MQSFSLKTSMSWWQGCWFYFIQNPTSLKHISLKLHLKVLEAYKIQLNIKRFWFGWRCTYVYEKMLLLHKLSSYLNFSLMIWRNVVILKVLFIIRCCNHIIKHLYYFTWIELICVRKLLYRYNLYNKLCRFFFSWNELMCFFKLLIWVKLW